MNETMVVETNQDAWDVYAKTYTQDLVDNDAIDVFEAGFLEGYQKQSSRSNLSDDTWYDDLFQDA